jgi:hypothetical protein
MADICLIEAIILHSFFIYPPLFLHSSYIIAMEDEWRINGETMEDEWRMKSFSSLISGSQQLL